MAPRVSVSGLWVAAVAAWHKSWFWKIVYGLLALLLINTAWVLKMDLPQTGRVVDKSTGRPVEGAVVMIHWYGDIKGPWFPVLATHVSGFPRCYHVEFSRTDKDGRFRTSPWVVYGPLASMSRTSFRWTQIRIYKEGYRWLHETLPEPPYALEPFVGSPGDRFDDLARASRISCPGVASERNEMPYLEAIYSEMTGLQSAGLVSREFEIRDARERIQAIREESK